MIIVHGIDYNHNGIYDNVLDRSELDNSLPGEATAPALCGTLVPTKTAAAVPGAARRNDIHRRPAPLLRAGGTRGPASRCCATCRGSTPRPSATAERKLPPPDHRAINGRR